MPLSWAEEEGKGTKDISPCWQAYLDLWDCKNPCDAVALNLSQAHAPRAQAHKALHWLSLAEVSAGAQPAHPAETWIISSLVFHQD